VDADADVVVVILVLVVGVVDVVSVIGVGADRAAVVVDIVVDAIVKHALVITTICC
jgi:hypothetical protein